MPLSLRSHELSHGRKSLAHAQFDSFDDRDIGIRGVNGSDTVNAFEGLQARAHRGQNDVAERAMHEQL